MTVFSERLTNARELKHWTRKRAVAEFGIPYQTYSNYEIIVVNDGSTEEGTKETLDEIAKLDSRIKIYHEKNN